MSPHRRDRHAGVKGSVLHGRNVAGCYLLIIKTNTGCIVFIRISLIYYKISKTKHEAFTKPYKLYFLYKFVNCR